MPDCVLFTDKMTNFATQNMNRTFHYKASLLNYAGAVVGTVLMLAVVLMVERIIHTAYVFTDDGLLVVSKGRFLRPVSIRVGDIIEVKRMRMSVLPQGYVLIRYGAGHELSVQPANEDAFINEIRRRQEPDGQQ